MKPMTLTAIVALLVSIPFVIKRLKTEPVLVRATENPRFSDNDHLYDIDELMT